MKYSALYSSSLNMLFVLVCLGCADNAQNNEMVEVEKKGNQKSIYHPPYALEKNIIDTLDKDYGYYFSIKPKDKIQGVLLLLPGLGQKAENIFVDTKLPEVAYENNLLTICYAGRTRMTADRYIQAKLNQVLADAIQKFNLSNESFVIGGFSAGGVIALRYTELCHQFPDQFPIQPIGVFMADAPVDLFLSWQQLKENLKKNFSKVSVDEANWVAKFYKDYYGATPDENPERFSDLSPFSIDSSLGKNEKHLQVVAVRAYHDVDISWRIVNRSQTPRFDNYIATAEMINRLRRAGNMNAEFIQTFKTGFRRNGDRHPHSWSIIDPEECIVWINKLILEED